MLLLIVKKTYQNTEVIRLQCSGVKATRGIVKSPVRFQLQLFSVLRRWN